MDAQIQAMFNGACCGGAADTCEAVQITGSLPAYNYLFYLPPGAAAVHSLNGTSPFTLTNRTTLYEFIDIQLSGNQVYIRVDTTFTSIIQTGVEYPITYTVENCAGGGSATYNGTITFTLH